MNKLLFGLFVLCLVSCRPNDGESVIETESNNRLLVDKFVFEGHDYIKFKNNYNVDAGTGVVHDPECRKCFVKFD